MGMKPPVRVLFLLVLLFFSVSCAAFARAVEGEPVLAPRLPTREATLPPTPLPTLTPTPGEPTPTPAPTTTPPSLLKDYMDSPELVAETEHFRVFAQDGYFPVDQDWWLEQMEVVYAYVSDRLRGGGASGKIVFGFLPPQEQACPVRGLASHDRPPVVLVFADEQSSREYLLGVLAHEVGHAISANFPNGLPDALAHTEGLATWASGKYGADWWNEADIHDYARGLIARGEYEPLTENTDMRNIYPWDNPGPDCLARRDKIYGEWGSFLGYLIDTYGWDRALDLFDSPGEPHDDSTPEPPQYEAVYGKSLEELEAEWLAFLTK